MRNAPDPSPWDLTPVQCQSALLLIPVWWHSHSHFIRISVPGFCLFLNTSSAFFPPLSVDSSLHVVRFGGQKNSTPLIKKLMLLQTAFLALAPKISYWDITSKLILIDHYPVIFFLWPQFQMLQGCLLWSRSCMNISAYILKNVWKTKLEGNFSAIQCS